MRAVAVLLVVLFHARVPGFSGGYVGVDVFFVVSGFVITGILLREKATTGNTSLWGFYARRARRIIPAATFVLVVTVLATYQLLGSVSGAQTAEDGKWVALFLGNFHFAASGTNYLASQRPPSPLQNYWSLAVEEQFYVVYPTIFLFATRPSWRVSGRTRLAILLAAVIVASLTLSIAQTATNPTFAYFSPFTRAWELALGALVAVATNLLRRLPAPLAASMTWGGLGAIGVAAASFNTTTAYPGSAVVIPVAGTALVIAGGAVAPAWGAEALMRLRPFQWLGLISYSLYLWHWPVLTIAAQWHGSEGLSVFDNLLLVLLALALAIGTYLLIENPLRHLAVLVTRRSASLAMGGCLVLTAVALTSITPGIPKTAIDTAHNGYFCPSPTRAEVTSLRTRLATAPPLSAPRDTKRLRVMVVGDSTACTMLPGLEAVGAGAGIQFENAAVVGCGVVSDPIGRVRSCAERASSAEAEAFARGAPRVVVWSSEWERAGTIGPGGRVYPSGSAEWKALLFRRMEKRVAYFAAQGATTVMLTLPPWATTNPAQLAKTDPQFLRLDTAMREFAVDHPDQVAMIDVAARVCPSGPPCPAIVDGTWLRPDGEHYGTDGSVWLARWIMPQILSLAGQRSLIQ